MGKYLDLIAHPVSEQGPRVDNSASAIEPVKKVFPGTQPLEVRDTVIEATLRPAIPWPELLATVKPQNPEFPPCPMLGRRYWIAPSGKVVCGSKKCAGAVRFLLKSIEFHPVQ